MSEMDRYKVTCRVWVSFHLPEDDYTVYVWVDPTDPEPNMEALAKREVERRIGKCVIKRIIRVERA
jgi:hypothetical protein